MSNIIIALVCILSLIYATNSYKILHICPMPGKSHSILNEGIVKHLVEAGHEVTYIAPFPPEKPKSGMTIIDISEIRNLIGDDGPLNIKDVMDKKDGFDFTSFVPLMLNLSRTIIENRNVQKLISDKNQHFDVVISEWLYMEVYAGFSGVFNCPLIWFSTVEPHWMVLQLIDEIPNPAYNVDIISESIPPLTFTQRIWELFLQVLQKLFQILYFSGAESKIYEELIVPHIHNRGLPVYSLDTLKYNASLILSNSHISMGAAARLPANFIPIGGYHIDTVVKPLPKDLQNIMDNAKHGVIYFSMGSNLRSKHFPKEIQQELLEVFGELKQTVLWKFEEDLPNRPNNVHILKWAPQQSILAHKNCVIFITHGGLLSTTETIHFGVPVIGIPVFADQFTNVERGVKKGYAKKVNLSYSMARELKIAIEDILNNPSYTAKVKELSTIYHHRSVHPRKELVHWVEHVVKTGGARHLRSPAFLMPWYQKLYLDLILILLGSLIAIKYVSCYIYSLIKNQKSISSKKNKISLCLFVSNERSTMM